MITDVSSQNMKKLTKLLEQNHIFVSHITAGRKALSRILRDSSDVSYLKELTLIQLAEERLNISKIGLTKDPWKS